LTIILRILTSIFLLSFANLQGQKYIAVKVEGLPQAEYYNCVQDEQGYMLFASDAGLIRWDRHIAVVYDYTNGLPDNSVLWVEKLTKGNLSYNNGYGLYKYLKGKIFRYRINDIIKTLSDERKWIPFILPLMDKSSGIENLEQFIKEGHGLSIVDQIIHYFNQTQKTQINTEVRNDKLNGDIGSIYEITFKT